MTDVEWRRGRRKEGLETETDLPCGWLRVESVRASIDLKVILQALGPFFWTVVFWDVVGRFVHHRRGDGLLL